MLFCLQPSAKMYTLHGSSKALFEGMRHTVSLTIFTGTISAWAITLLSVSQPSFVIVPLVVTSLTWEKIPHCVYGGRRHQMVNILGGAPCFSVHSGILCNLHLHSLSLNVIRAYKMSLRRASACDVLVSVLRCDVSLTVNWEWRVLLYLRLTIFQKYLEPNHRWRLNCVRVRTRGSLPYVVANT